MPASIPYPPTDGTLASGAQMNANLIALLAADNNSVLRDGTSPFTGNQSMGLNKLVSLANATLLGDAVNLGQLNAAVLPLAPLASPALTGTPTAPTAAAGTNTTQLATTGFVTSSGFAPLASPALTGTPTLNGNPLGSTPAGAVFHFAMSAVPAGYLQCNGAAVSRTTYQALFLAIGVVFGAGDQTTTFNLPELRGEFIRNWDNGLGVDPGRTFGSAQAADIAPHTHPITTYHGAGNDGLNRVSSYAVMGASDVSATNASTGVETRPRNIALLVCIKT